MAPVVCAVSLALASAPALGEGPPSQWVRPLSGTTGQGGTFPGACRPFGMVQPSPDTSDVHTPSGYKRDNKAIRGFSATHLNGTGCAALGDILLMPFTGASDGRDVASPWDRNSERAEPGYYSVRLERHGVLAEMTATERVAAYRFTWPEDADRRLLVDGATFLRNTWNAKPADSIPWHESSVSRDRRLISGSRAFRGWVDGETHYAVRFARAPDGVSRLSHEGFDCCGDRWVCDFGRGSGPVEVRVAVSTVSAEGAAGNLAEADGLSFDQIRADAAKEWDAILGRISVEGTDDFKRTFYTCLYHAFVQPNDIADRDGRYRGPDGEVRAAAKGAHYSTLSLWDTFRAAHPLYTIVVPERVPGVVASMLEFGRAHGHLPVWSLWGRDAHCMIGMHAIPVIADAWAKGFRDFNPSEALSLMIRSMTDGGVCHGRMDWNAWRAYGYLPCSPDGEGRPRHRAESVSRTIEQSFDWWCLAHFADMTGAADAARKAAKHADAWRHVIDPESGFARGRHPDGSWRTPFDPAAYSPAGGQAGDYTEANAWVYTWHVLHDSEGLAQALGGHEKALAKLDAFFGAGNKAVPTSGIVGHYWHGNEPSHHIAYLYTAWGRPDKTEDIVSGLCANAYSTADGGLCGNDDCGQMSAWFVFSALGLYPLNPCDGGYVLGAPQTASAVLALPGGGRLRIATENFGRGHVRKVLLDGRELPRRWISHSDLLSAKELRFVFEP